jgi:predicted phage terminase large subunit-like protein
MHYDLIICDDLHSEKNVTNKEQIEQVIDHWKLAYSLLDPGCPMIVIGTRWHFSDLYQHILDTERSSFNILIKRAINHDGTLLFPERLTMAFLDDVKRKQGSSIFSKQYLNEPVDDDSATFKRINMERKPWDLVKDIPINWYLSVDPSYEGEYSDYTAFVLAGMDHQRQVYVRHILRAKMTYSDIIQNMFDLWGRYKPKQILLETLGAQKSIMYELNNQQKLKGTWLPITEIKTRSASKEERIRGLAPFYEFHRIFHVKECPQLEDLEYELSTFPSGKHDDIIDALSTILEVATPTNGRVSSDTTKEKRHMVYKPRSPITGV